MHSLAHAFIEPTIPSPVCRATTRPCGAAWPPGQHAARRGRQIARGSRQGSELVELHAKFASAGSDALSGTPPEFTAFVADEVKKWAKLVKDVGQIY
jgi:tripartite-type tricarboxylate transporter receptor subunit TctC